MHAPGVARKMRVMIKVYTGGVFDILHSGHLSLLARAKALGDFLVVGIQTDEYVCNVRGKTAPIHTTEERVEQMRALPFADEVTTYESGIDPVTLSRIRPDIFVHGEDWLQQADRSAVITYMETHGIRMVLLPHVTGRSSSQIRKRIVEAATRTDLQ